MFNAIEKITNGFKDISNFYYMDTDSMYINREAS